MFASHKRASSEMELRVRDSDSSAAANPYGNGANVGSMKKPRSYMSQNNLNIGSPGGNAAGVSSSGSHYNTVATSVGERESNGGFSMVSAGVSSPGGAGMEKQPAGSLPYCILLPHQCVGYIIGKSGAAARDIEKESGAHINFQKMQHEASSRVADKLVAISGPLASRSQALRIIFFKVRTIAPAMTSSNPVRMSRSRDIEGSETLTVITSVCAIPHLIGPKGATINDLTNRSGCEFNIQRDAMFGTDDRAINIRSKSIEDITVGVEMLYQMLEEFVAIGKFTDMEYLRPLDSIFRGNAGLGGSYHGISSGGASSGAGGYSLGPTVMGGGGIGGGGSKTPGSGSVAGHGYGNGMNEKSQGGGYGVKMGYHSYDLMSKRSSSTAAGAGGLGSPRSTGGMPMMYGGSSSLSHAAMLPSSGTGGHMRISSTGGKMSSYSGSMMAASGGKCAPNNLLEHSLAYVNTRCAIRFIISAEAAAWIVGKGGSHIKDTKKITGAEIMVSDSKDQFDGLGENERLLGFFGSIINKFSAIKAIIGKICEKSTLYGGIYPPSNFGAGNNRGNNSLDSEGHMGMQYQPQDNREYHSNVGGGAGGEMAGGREEDGMGKSSQGVSGAEGDYGSMSRMMPGGGSYDGVVDHHAMGDNTDVLSSYQISASMAGSNAERGEDTGLSGGNDDGSVGGEGIQHISGQHHGSSMNDTGSGNYGPSDLRMLVPAKTVSFIIGRKGVVIRQITSSSGANVIVDDQKIVSGDRVLIVSGTGEAKLIAAMLIWLKLEEFESPELLNENLTIPTSEMLDKSNEYSRFDTPETNFLSRASKTARDSVFNTQQQFVMELLFPRINVDRLLKIDHTGKTALADVIDRSGSNISISGDGGSSYGKSMFLNGTPVSNSLACLLIHEKLLENDGLDHRGGIPHGGMAGWR